MCTQARNAALRNDVEAVRGLLEAVRQEEYDSKARFVDRWAWGTARG